MVGGGWCFCWSRFVSSTAVVTVISGVIDFLVLASVLAATVGSSGRTTITGGHS